MAYTIHKSDGTLVTIADNAIDNDFYNQTGGSSGAATPGIGQGIRLVGRNTIDYGTAIAQNFLQMTENFASATGSQPLGLVALQGQLWFNKTTTSLYVRTTPGVLGADSIDNWARVPVSNPATPQDGDMKTVDGDTFVYANGAWHLILTTASTETGRPPIVNPVGPANDGDMKTVGSVISIWANGAWRQVFPALYS